MSVSGSEISRTSSTAPVIRPHPSPAYAIGRTGLFIFLGISMVAVVVRVAMDFAGPLFGLAILDLIHILFLIAAFYGTWKYKPRFLGVFVTWLIFWFVWNILVICAFQEIGVLANTSNRENAVNAIIDLGAESTSFWSRSGPGCRQKTHDEMDKDHEEGAPYPYVGCSMPAKDAETVVAAVHIILAFIGFVMGMYEVYVFTEELDVLQRPKCESQDVYTISVGATPPGSASNVKLLEVDYTKGGPKFVGNHVFLPRFFYTCFCDGRSRLPGHWPPPDIEKVSGSGGAQMWETGHGEDKDAKRDFVDPMSRGRPNNNSSRSRSKSPSSSSTSSNGSQKRNISHNPNFSRDDYRRRSSQRSSRSKSKKNDRSNGHLNNSVASTNSTISTNGNDRSKSPASVQSTEDGKPEKPALWKRIIGLEELPQRPKRSSSRHSSSRSPKRSRNSAASTSTTVSNGSTIRGSASSSPARSSSRSPGRNSTRGAPKSPQTTAETKAKNNQLAAPTPSNSKISSTSSTSSSSPQRSPSRQQTSAVAAAAAAAAVEKDKQKTDADLAAKTKANANSKTSPKSPKAPKSSTSSTSPASPKSSSTAAPKSSSSSAPPTSPKSSKTTHSPKSSELSSSKTPSASTHEHKTKVKEQPPVPQQKQQQQPQQQQVQQQAPKEPSVEVSFDKDASKSSSTAPKVGKISYVSAGKISFDPEGPKKNGDHMVPLQDGTLDSTYTGDSSASCNGDDTGSESGGLRVRFNENPDVHHMSPRKNGTLTSLKKKLRMSSDGDEASKRNSGETKGKRSSATPHADSGFGSEHDSPQLQRMPRKSSLKKRNRNTSQASDRSSGVSENDIVLDPSGASSGASNPAFQGDDLSSHTQRIPSDTSSDEYNPSISMSPDGTSAAPRPNSSATKGATPNKGASSSSSAPAASAASAASRESTESPSPRNYPSSVEGTPRSGSPDHGYHADAEAERNGRNTQKDNSSPSKNNPKKSASFVNGAFAGEDEAANSSKPTSKQKPAKNNSGVSGKASLNPNRDPDEDRFSTPLRIDTSSPNQTLDSALGASTSIGSISTNPSSGANTPGTLLDSGASSPASSTGTGGGDVVSKTAVARKNSGKKKKLKSSASGTGSANSVASAASNASSNGSSSTLKDASGTGAMTGADSGVGLSSDMGDLRVGAKGGFPVSADVDVLSGGETNKKLQHARADSVASTCSSGVVSDFSDDAASDAGGGSSGRVGPPHPRTTWEAGTWATAIVEEDEQEGELKGRRELKDKNQYADALFIRNRPDVLLE